MEIDIIAASKEVPSDRIVIEHFIGAALASHRPIVSTNLEPHFIHINLICPFATPMSGRRNSSAIQTAANLASWRVETDSLHQLLPRDKPASQAAIYMSRPPFQQLRLQFHVTPMIARTQDAAATVVLGKGPTTEVAHWDVRAIHAEIQEIKDVVQTIAECVSKLDLQQQSSSDCAAKRFEEIQGQIKALESKASPSKFTDLTGPEIVYNSSQVRDESAIQAKAAVDQAAQRIDEQKFRDYITGCMREMETEFAREKEKMQIFASQIQDNVQKALRDMDDTADKSRARGAGRAQELDDTVRACVQEQTSSLARRCDETEYAIRQLTETLAAVRTEKDNSQFSLLKSLRERQDRALSEVEDVVKSRILEYARRKEDSDGRKISEITQRVEEVTAAALELSKKLSNTIEVQKLDARLAAKKEQNAGQYVAQLEGGVADLKAEIQNVAAKHAETVDLIKASMQTVETRTLESCTALSVQVNEVESKIQRCVELIDSSVNKAQLMYQQKADRVIDGLTSHVEMTRRLQDELSDRVTSRMKEFETEMRRLRQSDMKKSAEERPSDVVVSRSPLAEKLRPDEAPEKGPEDVAIKAVAESMLRASEASAPKENPEQSKEPAPSAKSEERDAESVPEKKEAGPEEKSEASESESAGKNERASLPSELPKQDAEEPGAVPEQKKEEVKQAPPDAPKQDNAIDDESSFDKD